MQEHERMIRPALGAIILICFFMPFLKISCAGQPLASISGVDLALGRTIEPPKFLNDGFGGSGWSSQANSADQSTTEQYQYDDSTAGFDQSASTDQSNPFADMDDSEMKIDSKPSVAAALALAVIALLGSFGGDRRAMFVSAAAAGVTAALLLILKANLGGEMPPEMAGVISIEWSSGFWGAVVASAALAIFTFSTINKSSWRREKPRLVIQSHYDKETSEPVDSLTPEPKA